MNNFKGILRLSIGDLLAKALNFLAFVHLARVLGLENYGVLEFALSTLSYILLLGDGGLELWATREIARRADVQSIVARVLPLKLLLAVGSVAVVVVALPALPDHPHLHTFVLLFCLTLFPQAVNLKWVFLGQEKMSRLATGLVVGQLVFALGVFTLVHNPRGVMLVPVLRVLGDAAVAVYFTCLFARTHGWSVLGWKLRGARELLKPALVMGLSQGLGLMNYNFDSVLIGFLLGPGPVGLYAAAYKPVTVALAIPATYFIGLFPVLSRSFNENQREFGKVVSGSLRLSAAAALPLAVVSTFLAKPIIELIFGSAYSAAAPVLMVLCWSGALVIMRGTCRQSLNAAGLQKLDLRCAASSVGLNVLLNVLLIPRYGIIGAAIATVVAEALWVILALYLLRSNVIRIRLLPILARPVAAALVLAAFLFLVDSAFFVVEASIGALLYVATLVWLSREEVHEWFQSRRAGLAGVARGEPTTTGEYTKSRARYWLGRES